MSYDSKIDDTVLEFNISDYAIFLGEYVIEMCVISAWKKENSFSVSFIVLG